MRCLIVLAARQQNPLKRAFVSERLHCSSRPYACPLKFPPATNLSGLIGLIDIRLPMMVISLELGYNSGFGLVGTYESTFFRSISDGNRSGISECRVLKSYHLENIHCQV